MADLVFVLLTIGLFGVLALVVRVVERCERCQRDRPVVAIGRLALFLVAALLLPERF